MKKAARKKKPETKSPRAGKFQLAQEKILLESQTVIKTARLNANLTQIELAEEMECLQCQVSDWEKGKRVISAPSIMRLAKILKIRLTENGLTLK